MNATDWKRESRPFHVARGSPPPVPWQTRRPSAFTTHSAASCWSPWRHLPRASPTCLPSHKCALACPLCVRTRHRVSHTPLAVSSQELAAEGKAVAVDHPNVAERALFALLQACPLDVAPSPFQYLLGCVCRNCPGPSPPRRCPPGDGVRLTQCLPRLSPLCRCYRRATDEGRRLGPRDGEVGAVVSEALNAVKDLVRRSLLFLCACCAPLLTRAPHVAQVVGYTVTLFNPDLGSMFAQSSDTRQRGSLQLARCFQRACHVCPSCAFSDPRSLPSWTPLTRQDPTRCPAAAAPQRRAYHPAS